MEFISSPYWRFRFCPKNLIEYLSIFLFQDKHGGGPDLMAVR